MSDDKKVPDKAEDPDLDALLDSALKDFDKPTKPPPSQKEDESSTSTAVEAAGGESTESTAVGEEWTEDFLKQAADQFQKNLEDLMQNSPNTEMGESFKKMAQTVMGAVSESGGSGNISTDFQTMLSQTLRDLSSTSENLQNPPSEADITAMFQQTTLGDGDFFPFMQDMMQSLLSKDVLYPSLKDLVDRYPAWLTEKKESLPPDDLTRYEKQFEIMQKVCQELESEKEDDTDEIKKKRFEKTLSLMQEMQTYGQPPDDLVSEGSPLLQLDADGNPIAPPALPGIDDSANCSVM